MTAFPESPVEVFEVRENVCPFIAVQNDRFTRYSYPTSGNVCHAARHPKGLPVEWQAEVCLTPAYCDCKVYSEASLARTENLPTPVTAQRRGWGGAGSILRLLLLSTGVVGLLAALVLFLPKLPLAGFLFVSTPTGTIAPAAAAPEATLVVALPPPSQTLAPAPSQVPPSPTVTPTPLSPTPTATRVPPTAFLLSPTLGPGMETPFGPQPGYLLHTVQVGESLGSLARKYNTGLEVLQALNVFVEGETIRPGRVLVILPGQTDPTGILRFQVVQLDQLAQVDALAGRYGISASDLRLYNSLGREEWIPAGRWLIILVTP